MTNDLMPRSPLQIYMLCVALLTLKMILTASAIGGLRVLRRVFITPEDNALLGATAAAPDEQIERLRRAHQNDLENILPFFAVGLLYGLTAPAYNTCWWLYWTFTIGRILHTLSYALGLQPWRTIFFEVANVALIATTVLLLLKVI